jgi:hypothetical protein
VSATRAEPTLKATPAPEAESTSKKDAASTVDERPAAKPKDDEEAEAFDAKPAPAPTREAESGSADAETAKSADKDDEPPASGDTDQQRQVTVVPGVPRYHTENCILIRFMDDDDMQQMSLKAATDAGCTPCGACQPDD